MVRTVWKGSNSKRSRPLNQLRRVGLFWLLLLNLASGPSLNTIPAGRCKPRGILEWKIKLRGVGRVPPGVSSDGTIYVGAPNLGLTNGVNDDGSPISTREQNLFAIQTNGTVKWTFHTKTGVRTQPVVGRDGSVYIAEDTQENDNGTTISESSGGFDAILPSGKLRWSTATYYWKPVVGPDGTVYVSSPDSVSALQPDGSVIWKVNEHPNSYDGFLQATLAWGHLCFADQTSVYCSNLNGSKSVVARVSDLVTGNVYGQMTSLGDPVLARDGTIYITANENLLGNDSFVTRGKLWALRPGRPPKCLLVSSGTTNDPVGSAAVSGGTIFTIVKNTKLLALSQRGRVQWSFQPGGTLTQPAFGADGTLYLGSSNHELYALNSRGKKLWSFTAVGEVSAPPAVGPDGTVFVVSEDGYLYAVASHLSPIPPSRRQMKTVSLTR